MFPYWSLSSLMALEDDRQGQLERLYWQHRTTGRACRLVNARTGSLAAVPSGPTFSAAGAKTACLRLGTPTDHWD
jgi:hypothetical protein